MHVVGARVIRVLRLTGVKYAHNYLHKQKLYNESIGITLTKHIGHPEVKKKAVLSSTFLMNAAEISFDNTHMKLLSCMLKSELELCVC